MEVSNNNPNQYASVHFSVGDEVLLATPQPSQLSKPLDKPQIQALLEKFGYVKHRLDDELIEKLIKLSAENATKPISLEAHTDAHVDIEVSPDQLKASIHFTPAFCGEDISVDELFSALLDSGIPESNIDKIKLSSILNSKEPREETIAEGMAAINGEDAYFEILFNGDSEKRPQETEDGLIDHYETHDYITVPVDAPLMRRHPPTPGTKGITIFDETIEAEAGKDLKFELNKSVKIAQHDTNLLVSTKSGHPIASANSVEIDETLTLNEASLETGNIHFDGSVYIKGEVKPNVIVEASGDIYVKGLVENAKLIAGNDINIKSGVVSSQLFDEEDQSSFDYGCEIRAINDIHLRYCNSIHANAGGSIFIENYSMHSRLHAKKDILAGANKGKGVLLGGEIHAQENIEAKKVGSKAYVKTELYCANILKIRQQFYRSQHRLTRIKDELEMLNVLLVRIKKSGSPATVGEVILEKAKRIYREIKELQKEQKFEQQNLIDLKHRLEPDAAHRILIHKKIYPNTHIVVNDAHDKTAHTHGKCSIRAVKGELHFRDPKEK